MSTLDSFEENLQKICKQYTKDEVKYTLLVSDENYPKVQNLLKQNGMTFVVRDSETYKGIQRRLSWSSCLVSFFKTPFYIEKSSTLHCTVGPRYFANHKKCKPVTPSILQDSNLTGNSTLDGTGKTPSTRRRKPSKKVGCNATMRVIVLKTFPEYCIQGVKCLKDEKLKLMKKLKERLKNDSGSVISETVYYVSFSTAKIHCHPIWESFKAQHIDPALKNEIRTLVENGITNVQTIKVLLCKWVKENIGDVNDSSRAYWPTKKTIQNHVLKYVPSVAQKSKTSHSPSVTKKNKTSNKAFSKPKTNSPKKPRTEVDNNLPIPPTSTLPEPVDVFAIELSVSSEDVPELEYVETIEIDSNYEDLSNCSKMEICDSAVEYAPKSKIRNLIKTIYDRSFLLPYDCTDPVLHDKLLDVYNIMNNCIDRDQNIIIP